MFVRPLISIFSVKNGQFVCISLSFWLEKQRTTPQTKINYFDLGLKMQSFAKLMTILLRLSYFTGIRLQFRIACQNPICMRKFS